ELRDALAAGGCPLCRLGRRAASRYIDTLNYEGVNDPGLRRALRDAHGLCHRHAWEWTRLRGSPLGIAIVYRNLVKDLAEVVEGQAEGRGAGRSGRRPAAARLAPAGRCPACRAEDEAVQRYGRTLLAWLAQEELAAAYIRAGGLCLPHLREVLAQADDAQARVVLSWQQQIYRALIAQLDEFIRKHDHRFREEPFGAEKDVWQRALAALAGELWE
ncbi:MAG: DUF6062 family protein, partial [Anaerolineae bacterium]|nr:DUF6062 family protein [Anaerolineae bacterium]